MNILQKYPEVDSKMTDHFNILFTGYSMHPFLKPGDRLVVKPTASNSLQIGDIVVARNTEDSMVAHRLIRILPDGRGITKGDSMLSPDLNQVDLSQIDGMVTALIRKQRLIPVSTGPRSWLKRWYAQLSRMGLTPGALKLRIKNALTI